MMRMLWILTCLWVPLAGHAQVYSYIDANGNRVFTDRPNSASSTALELKPINSMPSDPDTLFTRKVSPPTQDAAPNLYQSLVISNPTPDSTIHNGAGELWVNLLSQPELQAGDQYQALLDGQPFGPPSSSPSILLSPVDRGSHQLQVSIIDAQGKTLLLSENLQFHMRRISLSDKRRVMPCTKNDYGKRPECPLKDKPKEKVDIPFVPFF